MLDSQKIFQGEIQQAQGSTKTIHQNCEYLMFTEDNNIINEIEKNDWVNNAIQENNSINSKQQIERPSTGSSQDFFQDQQSKQVQQRLNVKEMIKLNKQKLLEEDVKQKKETILDQQQSSSQQVKTKKLIINILESQSDQYYVGLTGIEIYNEFNQKILLNKKNINANPRDMSVLPGYQNDTRVLENLLINDQNQIQNSDQMWLIPYQKGKNHYIYINFDEETTISGIRIWNYNSLNEIDKGVKILSIIADQTYLTPKSGIQIKKALNTFSVDFSQYIKLPNVNEWDDQITKLIKNPPPKQITQEYITPHMPVGFTLKIICLTNWGDPHYIGLNGIELYNYKGDQINKNKIKIAANPESVRILQQNQNDERTIDKLIDGVSNTQNDKHMWLSPFVNVRFGKQIESNNQLINYNIIYISFDEPQYISCINFWNYSKTPNRGVKDIEIFYDDDLIYKGNLNIANQSFQSILFNHTDYIIQKIKPNVLSNHGKKQQVLLYNEKRAMHKDENIQKNYADLERPYTSVLGL